MLFPCIVWLIGRYFHIWPIKIILLLGLETVARPENEEISNFLKVEQGDT